MKTKSLTLLLCLFYSCAFYLQAQSISEEVARKEAYRFLQENPSTASHKKNISSANTQLLLTEKRQLSNGEPAYYIFNRGSAEGFIVIAAQNEATVLGYADNGLFDTDQIPVGLQEMLDDYTRELEWASNHPKAFAPASQSNSIERKAIAPMCEALWNQNDPYNRMAPVKDGKTCVTGCVATAMAIIMYHHRWPEQGEGSSGEVDFSSARYGWDQMTPVYNEESSEESCQAVAQLMYHCGVAVNMKYGVNESSAVVKLAAPALNNHFGYKGALFAYRDQYGAAAWTDLIYNELAEGRPVLYAGGSHAFVCDGYDGNGYFHFNFGWGGFSNGYFRLYSIIPGEIGIGGGTGDYSSSQQAIYGIERPDTNRHIPLSIIGNFIHLVDTGDGQYLYYGADVVHAGEESLTIESGLEIESIQSGERQFHSITEVSFPANYSQTSYQFEADLQNLPQLPVGEYRLYPAYYIANKDKTTIIPFAADRVQYLSLSVSESGTTISLPETKPTFDIQITTPHRLYSGKNAKFNMEITAHGYEYVGTMQLILSHLNSSSTWQLTRAIALSPEEPVQFTWDGVLSTSSGSPIPAGEYKLRIQAQYNTIFEQDITVLPLPEPSVIELAAPISVKNQGAVSPDDFEADITLRCTEGSFVGEVFIECFDSNGNGIADPFVSEFLELQEGEEWSLKHTPLLTAAKGTIAEVAVLLVDQSGTGSFIGPESYNRIPFLVDPEHYLAIEDSTIFPDTEFQRYLHSIDWLGDGYISDYELHQTTYINVNNQQIQSLKGIEYFERLTRLDCNHNEITRLDLSRNSQLSEINCQYNQLDSLILENHSQLSWLSCNDNRLTQLRIYNAPSLSMLFCGNNQLQNFDFDVMPQLTDLFADNNPLTHIADFDFEKLPALKMFNLANSQATSFSPVSTSIVTLVISGNNNLQNIDLSNCEMLSTLHIQSCPVLSDVLTDNPSLTSILLYENPKLAYIDLSPSTLLSDFSSLGCPLFMLDLTASTRLTSARFENYGCSFSVTLNEERAFDLSEWINEKGFNPDCISNLKNAELKGNLLYFKDSYIEYDYLTGNNTLPSIHVSLKYDGETSSSTPKEIDTRIYTVGRQVIIKEYNDELISVFSTTGQLLFNKQESSFILPQAGLYIIKVGNQATLVSVP